MGHLQISKDTNTKGWKIIFQANRNQKKANVAILISDKVDFKPKMVTRDKESHYIMIKWSVNQDIKTVNILYSQHPSTKIC